MTQDNVLFEKLEEGIKDIQRNINFNDESQNLYHFYYDDPPREKEALRLHVGITTDHISPMPSFYHAGYISILKVPDGKLEPLFEFAPDENLQPQELAVESENVDWQKLIKSVRVFCESQNRL